MDTSLTLTRLFVQLPEASSSTDQVVASVQDRLGHTPGVLDVETMPFLQEAVLLEFIVEHQPVAEREQFIAWLQQRTPVYAQLDTDTLAHRYIEYAAREALDPNDIIAVQSGGV